MVVKKGKIYACSYCGKTFTDSAEYNSHHESHNLIYVALTPDDLNRLVNFIYTKEERLLSDNLVARLKTYLRWQFSIEQIKKGNNNDF